MGYLYRQPTHEERTRREEFNERVRKMVADAKRANRERERAKRNAPQNHPHTMPTDAPSMPKRPV